jgi:hypothetical protein
MTTGVVTFDPAAFIVRFPEFTTVSADALTAYFNEGTLVLDNTDASTVQQIEQRTPLLWLLTAHLAALYSGVNGQAPAQLVGRINNASEGSVSVATDYGTQPATAAFYLQTKYGAQYWQMTASIRALQYVPGFPQAHPYPLPGFRWGMQ